MNKTLQAALTYASWGWRVLPLLPDAKTPLGQSHGVRDATTDEATITRWFEGNPNLNVGVAAGKETGIIVFDIDPRNGGDNTWAKWQEENGKVPDGAVAMTAGGGYHYLATYTEDLRSCKFLEGVDLLSDGRYFVAAPSVVNGKPYEWEASSDPHDGVAPFTVPPNWITTWRQQRGISDGSRQLAPNVIAEGERNDALTAIAGAMRHHGLSYDEILAAIAVANDARCNPPMPASQLRQIARSVARYEPDADVATSAALGSAAANAILAGIETQDKTYYFTSGTSLMAQPAPMEWAIKHWVPRHGTWMLYGPSGVGKSFAAIAMAAAMAHGRPWCSNKTSAGYVVYMAGEGNYGMRSRIASYAKHHGLQQMDKLLVSNRGIDLDAPAVAAQIVDAITEVLPDGEDVTCVIIDTLNNHMSGDENSAQDTRRLIQAAGSIGAAFGASVGIVHHTGNAEEARFRARGSSAIKASMDAQIMLSREKQSDLIKVTCTKMKDGREPEPIFCKIEEVDLGWVDEDGENQLGGVFVPVGEEEEPKAPDPHHKIKDEFKRAWAWSDYPLTDDGKPCLPASQLQNWYEQEDGKAYNTARKYAAPRGSQSRMAPLLEAGFLTCPRDVYVVEDEYETTFLMMERSMEQAQ